jgi:hypothetical protein
MSDVDDDQASSEDAELSELGETESPLGRLDDAEAEPLLMKLASGEVVSSDEYQRMGGRLAEPYNPQARAAMMSPAGVAFARRLARDHVSAGGGLLHRHLFQEAADLLTGEPVAYWTESSEKHHSPGPVAGTSYDTDVLTLKDGGTRQPVGSIRHWTIWDGFAQTWCLVWGTPDQGGTVVLVNPMTLHHTDCVLCTKIHAITH